MCAIRIGEAAPAIPGVDLSEARALYFYKVTCPVCQMSAPITGRLAGRYPNRVVGIGQDPPDRLDSFSSRYGLVAPSVTDPPPYASSDAYGITVVPTLFLVEDGKVADVVESWDRDGYNRVAERLAQVTGMPDGTVSEAGDGLPPFRPG